MNCGQGIDMSNRGFSILCSQGRTTEDTCLKASISSVVQDWIRGDAIVHIFKMLATTNHKKWIVVAVLNGERF